MVAKRFIQTLAFRSCRSVGRATGKKNPQNLYLESVFPGETSLDGVHCWDEGMGGTAPMTQAVTSTCWGGFRG